MVSKITEGVTVSVETFYQPEYSNPANSEYMFAYRVTMQNHNVFPIKLLSRHWFIFDSNGTKREVEGEGVIGLKPVIDSQDRYQYVSGCNLNSDAGKMHGTYIFENVHNKKTFTVAIPAFEMITPFKLN